VATAVEDEAADRRAQEAEGDLDVAAAEDPLQDGAGVVSGGLIEELPDVHAHDPPLAGKKSARARACAWSWSPHRAALNSWAAARKRASLAICRMAARTGRPGRMSRRPSMRAKRSTRSRIGTTCSSRRARPGP